MHIIPWCIQHFHINTRIIIFFKKNKHSRPPIYTKQVNSPFHKGRIKYVMVGDEITKNDAIFPFGI